MMRKFPKRAWMSFCHDAICGAPSCLNFRPLRQQEARSVGLTCHATGRLGLSRSASSAVGQDRQFSSDRALAITARLPRCITWDNAMIDEISPTAKAAYLKRRARPHAHAVGYKPRRRAENVDHDRRVRPPLQRARAVSLIGMPLLTQVCVALALTSRRLG